MDFKFGLFGNWELPTESPPPPFWQLKKWRHYWRKTRNIRSYQKMLGRISQGGIANRNLPTLYSSSKIILNCTGEDSLRCGVGTLRTYEVLACRGFLISDFASEELKDAVVITEEERTSKRRFAIFWLTLMHVNR